MVDLYMQIQMSRDARKPVFGVSDQVRHKPVRAAKRMARSLKFRIQEEEGLFYPSSENKDADQLCSYCTADLRLCVRIGKSPVFSWRGSNIFVSTQYLKESSHLSENRLTDTDLRFIAKNSFCLIDLMLYVPVNSYGHVGTLELERDVKQYIKQTRTPF